MAKVHWVSNETPDRSGQGGQRRQFFQIQALARRGHDVTVFSLAGPQDDASLRAIAEVVRVDSLELRGRVPLPWRWWRLRCQLAADPDVIVVAHTESWLRFEPALPRSVPTLVDVHNVFSRWTPPGTPTDESSRWRAIEQLMRDQVDALATLSPREAAALPDGRAHAFILSSGIDPEEWPLEPQPAETPVLKLFGNWDWTPNALGLQWLLDDVWPEVHATTGAVCAIAGQGVEKSTLPAGVVSVGRVPTVSAFLHNAWCVGVPVLAGVGAPVKFNEAMAVGVPVIATSDGCPAPDPPAVVSDDARTWVETLKKWLDPQVTPGTVPGAERATRLHRLSWDTLSEPLIHWVESQAVDTKVPGD